MLRVALPPVSLPPVRLLPKAVNFDSFAALGTGWLGHGWRAVVLALRIATMNVRCEAACRGSNAPNARAMPIFAPTGLLLASATVRFDIGRPTVPAWSFVAALSVTDS